MIDDKMTELESALAEARSCIDSRAKEGTEAPDGVIVGRLIREIRELRWYRDAYTRISDTMQELNSLVGGDPAWNIQQLQAENARLKDDLNTIGLVMVREKIEAGRAKR